MAQDKKPKIIGKEAWEKIEEDEIKPRLPEMKKGESFTIPIPRKEGIHNGLGDYGRDGSTFQNKNEAKKYILPILKKNTLNIRSKK